MWSGACGISELYAVSEAMKAEKTVDKRDRLALSELELKERQLPHNIAQRTKAHHSQYHVVQTESSQYRLTYFSPSEYPFLVAPQSKGLRKQV